MQNSMHVVVVSCLVLIWSLPCSSQHMCDVQRWVSDNQVPINKLDLSSTSKTKLVQSVRSDSKQIKCSELRLIHKEAELDRPFKQNHYKVKQQKGVSSSVDGRQLDRTGDMETDGYKNEDRHHQDKDKRSDRRDENKDYRRDKQSDDRYNDERDTDQRHGREHDQQHDQINERQDEALYSGGQEDKHRHDDIKKEPSEFDDESMSSHGNQDHVKNQDHLQSHEYQSKVYINAQAQSTNHNTEKDSTSDSPVSIEAALDGGTERATQENAINDNFATKGAAFKADVDVNSRASVDNSDGTVSLKSESESEFQNTDYKSEDAETRGDDISGSSKSPPKNPESEPEITESNSKLAASNPESTEPKLEFSESKPESTGPKLESTEVKSDSAESGPESTVTNLESTKPNPETIKPNPESTSYITGNGDSKNEDSASALNDSTQKAEVFSSLLSESASNTNSSTSTADGVHPSSTNTSFNNSAVSFQESPENQQQTVYQQPEIEMTARLKQYFNDGFNRTKSLRLQSWPNRNQHANLIRQCISCPRESNFTQSWKLCHVFFTRTSQFSHSATRLSVSKNRLHLTNLCQQTSSVYAARLQDKSVYFCESFFSASFQKPHKSNPGKSAADQNTNNVLSNITKFAPSQAGSLIQSCLQCPANTAINATSVLKLNKTLTICVFLTSSNPLSSAKQQFATIADKLQFIDDPTVVSRKSSGDIPRPAAGGELQDTEMPTRARQSIDQGDGHMESALNHSVLTNQSMTHQLQTIASQSDSLNISKNADSVNESKNASSPSIQQGNLPKETLVSPGPDNDLKMHQQINILSHSAFMEKLFDSLMTKRRPYDNANTKAQRDNLTQQVDRLANRLDFLVNVTAQKTNRSEAEELRAVLLNLETKLNSALNKLELRNKHLLDQIRRFELITSSKISACQRQLRRANSGVRSMAQRQNRQLMFLTRRITQMSKDILHVESKCNKTTTVLQQPDVPAVLQPTLDCSRPNQLSDNRYLRPPTATLGDSYYSIDDCSDLYERESRLGRQQEASNGVFPVNLGLPAPQRVRCDIANGGWTYILSRNNGLTEFFRNWTSYRAGFGDPASEYFIGLDALARMTSRRRYKLWVVLEDWEGAVKNVGYGQFNVQDEKYNYQLNVNQFNGDPAVGDSLTSHSNASFSTFDFDNDLVESKFGGNCAQRFRGGFWYFSCFRANPTGLYYQGGQIPDKKCDGIVWKTWKGPHYSLKSFHMKIKPV